MSAPATIPFVDPRPGSRVWSPSDRDRLAFQWVKFEGKTQGWVAEQLDIHQSTVSRMVERYERWIAHGGPARQGGLVHDERLRAQRWLTYERNEWILSSALRIAGEMEQAIDSSKSTITRTAANPSQEAEVRTQHERIDRSAIAARYLRLAYRVNMEQLKLVEQEPLPELEPLTIDDAGDGELPAIAEVSSGGGAAENAAADGGPHPGCETEHQTHNEERDVLSASRDDTGDCAKESTLEKTPGHAYAVADFPPETTEMAGGVGVAVCLPPRLESVALAVARQSPDGFREVAETSPSAEMGAWAAISEQSNEFVLAFCHVNAQSVNCTH